MTAKLDRYRKKRDFSRTGEPSGADQSGQDQGRYVMHMHAASHDHFDLRLEQNGVLRSWALPKGPSLTPGEKRLAVEVEDHPLEYGQFEGIIPEGEYGGGTVMLWDRGRWQPRSKQKEDRIDFDLEGEKLKGHWTLVRTKDRKSSAGQSGRHWLMIKRSDEVLAEPDDRSVATGRTMDQIAREEAPAPMDEVEPPDAARLEKARKTPAPDTPDVQLATLVQSPPEGEEWIHELKFDGYRLLARVHKGRVTLTTRNGKDWTRRFPDIVKALEQLPVNGAIIDGEIVAPQTDGSTSFRKLQEWLSTKSSHTCRGKLAYQMFDLLYLEGYDLRKTPLLERKGALEQLLRALGQPEGPLRYSDHISGQGARFYEQVCELGLEGMVSKNARSVYGAGRQRTWLKTKCTHQDEFVVGGFTRPTGARQGFGSLLLGAYEDNGLVYVGRVGSGFSSHQLASLSRQLNALMRKTSPFSSDTPETTGVHWVTPKMVVDVEFTERTGSGALRHPVFRGLREDKSATEVQMTPTARTESSTRARNTKSADKRKPSTRSKNSRSDDPVVAGVAITHPDRVLFPEHGITKLDVARYYEQVADHMLPHLANRPLSLLRCPEGLAEECFFQKHPDTSFARDVPRISIEEKQGGTSTYLYVTSASDLVGLVQYGVLEFHPWGCTISDVEKPDTLIFDLDPGPDVPWRAISHAATTLRDRLDDLGLVSFLQASGGKGLHLVVPVKPRWEWDDMKAFTQGISEAHAADDPKALTTNMSKNRRRGKVFIDYLRNGRGNTSIARYSTRAREHATVATPLRWDELTPGATANRYTVNNLRRRLSALKADPWEGYEDARNTISKRLLDRYRGG